MAEPTVHIVDDDDIVRRALTLLFRSVNRSVRTYATAGEFLEAYRADAPGCLIMDIRMPGMSGLQLLQELRSRAPDLPVIAMSGHDDLETAVTAMRLGAVHYLRKPFKQQEILDEVNRCIAEHTALWQQRRVEEDLQHTLDDLTERELEILKLLVKGASSKEVGTQLGISVRTVEAHRRSILSKFRSHSMFELAQRVKDLLT
jgi:FixJ family two-component response regulator